MINLGIAGLGGWGKNLVKSVQGKSDAVRFTVAATRTPAKIADFCSDHDIRLSDDLSIVLEDPTVDGVVVAGPAQLHAEVAIAALEAGKHVMVIKPLALFRKDAEGLRRAAEYRGLVLAMGHDRCFLPAVDELRNRVKAGGLGRIIHAEGDFCVDRYFDLSDTVTVSMRFAGGASGSLTALGVTPVFHRLHLFGTEGWAEIRNNRRFEFRPLKGEGTVTEFPAFDALKRQLESFAAAITGDAPFPVSPDDAVAGVAALEAMGRSAQSGRIETV